MQVTIWKFALLCVVFFSFLYFRNSFQKRPLPLLIWFVWFTVPGKNDVKNSKRIQLQLTMNCPPHFPYFALPYFSVLGTHEGCFLCVLRQPIFKIFRRNTSVYASRTIFFCLALVALQIICGFMNLPYFYVKFMSFSFLIMSLRHQWYFLPTCYI